MGSIFGALFPLGSYPNANFGNSKSGGKFPQGNRANDYQAGAGTWGDTCITHSGNESIGKLNNITGHHNEATSESVQVLNIHSISS